MGLGCLWVVAFLCFYHVQFVSTQLSPVSGYVTPSGFRIRKNENERQVIVRYMASSKPTVQFMVDGEPDSDLNVTVRNVYSTRTQTGSARITMPTPHFSSNLPKIRVDFQIEDFNTFLVLQNSTILDSRNFRLSVSPVYLHLAERDTLEYVKGEQLRFNFSLQSEELNQYEVDRCYGTIDSFDYGVLPPERLQWSASTLSDMEDRNRFTVEPEQNPFILTESFEQVNASTLTRECRLNTSFDYVSGKGILDLTLNSREHPIIKQMILRRIFYIQEVGQASPYRENTLLMIKPYQWSYNIYDVNIIGSEGTFVCKAIGYPKPEISLKRGCANETGNTVATELTSGRYETRVRYTFPGSDEHRSETFTVTARSGNFEVSDFITVEPSA